MIKKKSFFISSLGSEFLGPKMGALTRGGASKMEGKLNEEHLNLGIKTWGRWTGIKALSSDPSAFGN